MKVKLLSHVQLFVTPWTIAYQTPQSMEFSRQEYWSGLPFHSPGDLPDPGIEPGFPHCRQTLYCLRHQGSSKIKVKFVQLCPSLCNPTDYTVQGILQARILEWVAFPFSRGSSQPRDQTQVSHILYQLSYKGSPLSYVRVCIKLAYFSLKCLVEFLSQPI